MSKHPKHMNRRQQLAQEFIERVGFDNEEEYVKMKDLREAALRVVQEPTGTLRHLCVRASRLWYRLCSYSDLG